MLATGIRVINPKMAEFLQDSQIKQEIIKEQINDTNDSFDEILAAEIRLLDINYIRTMNILGGR